LINYLKGLWIGSVVFFTGYAIVAYAENGFDDLMLATWIALVCSGAGWIYKKKK
tara:strand:+ start:1483 stop:1644 length:162 start_codon:yes stop_codon:yes gene_type:complete